MKKKILNNLKVYIRFRIPVLRWLVHEKDGEIYITLFRAAFGRFIWIREFQIKKVCTEQSYTEHTTKMDKAICDRLESYTKNYNDK